MTTNREWLYSLDVADLADWFDAEHVETEERALDFDTAALEAEYGKGGLVGGSFIDIPEQGEVVMPLESWREYLGAESENEDSRDKLEADVRKIAEAYNMDTQRHGTERFAHELYYSIIHLLDRQKALEYDVCDECSKEYYELQDERDELKEKLEAAYAKNRSLRQHISQMQNGRNEWHVKAVRLEKQLEVTNKRCEEYREKFGKCLDYADAIHALMDDEGMA